MRRIILPILLLLAPSAHAACDIAGFGTDRDPAGTNIRATPGGTAIGRLPAPIKRDDTLLPVEFRITDIHGDWIRIHAAEYGAYFPRTPRFHFAGPGWVHASLAATQTGSHRLRAAPKADAPTVVELSGTDKDGNGWGADSITIRRIHACDGKFAEVTVKLPTGQQARGWVRNTCSNQVTTCDGYDPDEDD